MFTHKRYFEYIIKYGMVLLLVLMPVNIIADQVFNWDDCLKEAKSNHPDLLSARDKVDQARAGKAAARSNLLPQLSTSVSAKTSESSGSDQSETYAYSVSGEQLLFDGFKTRHKVNKADQTLKASEFDYQVTSSNIRLRLRRAFVLLLRAQELVGLTESIALRRRQNVELIQLRYKAGREHRGSLLTEEANLAQADFEAVQAKRNLDLAQHRLNKELGRPQIIPLKVAGALEVVNLDRGKKDFEVLAKSTPFLQELTAKKEAARLGLETAKADFFPRIYAATSIGRSDSVWPAETETWSAKVSVSFPIFEGAGRLAEVSRSRAALSQAKAVQNSGRDTVMFTLAETWVDFEDAVDKILVQNKFLEAAGERARITQAQYSTGLISFDDWIIIENDLVKTKKSFLDTQANALLAEADWFQAKGGTLDDK